VGPDSALPWGVRKKAEAKEYQRTDRKEWRGRVLKSEKKTERFARMHGWVDKDMWISDQARTWWFNPAGVVLALHAEMGNWNRPVDGTAYGGNFSLPNDG
jgi:hypothetical protein